MWLKYSSAPILPGEQWDRDQDRCEETTSYSKPRGFWITDDSEDCWASWCLNEHFSLEDLTHKHEVVLDESNILILRSASDLDVFTHKFGFSRPWEYEGRKYSDFCIDWRKVARRYDGLIITPYQWTKRLTLNWYYPWDCSSGCIWRARAIIDVRLLEIDNTVLSTTGGRLGDGENHGREHLD
jgi:hypothetical protein